jgi:polysaccharide biosynthesis/export protein
LTAVRLTFWGQMLAAVAVLAACDLPRGAPETNEIIAGAEDPAATFEVQPVTRDTLDRFRDWPVSSPMGLDGWIKGTGGNLSQIIEAGDTVSLTVWDNEERSLLTNGNQKVVELSDLVVSPSGTVFLPYVSEVYIAKMSPDEARAAIQDKMVMIVPSAQVQLNHEPGSRSSVDLISGVNEAGNYPLLTRDMTVLGAIAQGGGVAKEITNPQVRLLRDGKQYGISLDKLLKSPELDTRLRGGDKIYVETDERFFLSFGAAGREAQFPFPTDLVTALDAASIIGGVNENRGNPKGVLILRDYAESAVRADGSGPAKERVIFTFDLTTADGLFSAGDFPVQHRDLVLVTESPLNSTRTILGLVFEALGIGIRAQDLAAN